MLLAVSRGPAFMGAIIGDLFIDGRHECFTLEHEGREIPIGSYPVVVTLSNRFRRLLPILCNVPGRSGIRIHAGNSSADSDGCILVGEARGITWVHGSLNALEKLNARILVALAAGDTVTLTLVTKPATVIA